MIRSALQTVHFYETPQSIRGIFDNLFGGFFVVKGIPLIGQLGILTLVLVSLAAGFFHLQSASERSKRLSLLCSGGVFILLWLFFIQPWDEVFINLRHSLNWAESNRFSFNRFEWKEGTVDFLPYFAVGILAKLGLPILELAFVQGLLGGFACLALAWNFWKLLGIDRARPLLFLLVVLYPPLGFNSAHGFATLWFTAACLLCVRWVFFSEHPRRGLVLAALLPCIRIEGIALTLLLWGYLSWKTPRAWVTKCLSLIAILSPVALHTLVRASLYGEPIPLPVLYKSTWSFFFFAIGIRNLIADLLATHTAVALTFLALLHFLNPQFLGKQSRPALLALGCLGFFVLPYYSSGGDWFPSYWGRYLFPCAFLAVTVSLAAFVRAWENPKRVLSAASFCFFFFVLSSLWPISSTWKAVAQVFSHRRTLAMIHEPTISRAHYRIQHLSQLGSHLEKSSEPSARIGSSELATVMFFSHREAVDFLGLVNPQIAKGKLRPHPSLIRRFPERSELPHLIFRRLQPELLEKEQPEYLYTFDFLMRDQVPENRSWEVSPASLFLALSRWEVQLGGLVEALYGGLPKILSLGYEPFIIRYSNGFVGLYFVHSKVIDQHVRSLKRLGFSGKVISRERD